MYSTIGVGITILIFAVSFLIMAILFSIKGEYYDKFLNFMNPGLYSAYCEKGNDFIIKKRRMNVICYYLLSAIMGLNAYTQIRLMTRIDAKYLFNWRDFWPYALVFLVLFFIVNHISILAAKKSKTANEDLVWNIIIGIIVAIILVAFVSFNISRTMF